ncbi:MAG: acyl-CoA dehydratase activase [Thermodesulfobacteriota bacterium]
MTSKQLITAGIDIGAATAKVVILKGGKILSALVIPTGGSVKEASRLVMEKALGEAQLSLDDITSVVATGYGRKSVDFANHVITEISCHARGVNLLIPSARSVIDIGGQDSKVIEVNDQGRVVNFAMNDKCAAGTGRFLEVMATVLGTDIGEIGSLSLQGQKPCQISNTCTVFAESEMVSLRAEGENRENILAGIHLAMAHRVAIMGNTVGLKEEIVFTGGVAKNVGMKMALQKRIGKEIRVPEQPQIIGALGAAAIGAQRLRA